MHTYMVCKSNPNPKNKKHKQKRKRTYQQLN